ncbi:hypothetical protein ACTOB_002053 [Actinoplanes oblitus]|uniref:Methyltransferase type 11 domain-containing protein n=1 Tax=Actinoplanes oblitus TaxID=3040509 RepID=A0ABY8WLU9_9ACTN|nr:hypothetical protein [Actinoplanes oblitus]WIM98452.1 hypothetical protein ACTOB_002053 [Actinoplanes oblitus]
MSVRLIGGEMPHWAEPPGSGAHGPALAALAAATHGRTLVIGPHAPEIVAQLTARELTFLVRGTRDAEPLAHHRVWCGSLATLAAEPEFDTVLALGGLDAAGTTESGDLPWAEALSRVLGVLRPGGRLLLGLANPAGLHRLVALPAEPGPADWSAPAEDDPTRPVSLPGLAESLRSAGLEVDRGYAALPEPAAPSALLSTELLDDPAMLGFLQSTMRRALVPRSPLLADPRPIAVRLLRSGLAMGTAPAWFVVATRPAPAASSSPTPDLPHALITPPAGRSPAVRVFHDPARGWVHSGAAATLPAGRCLHDALVTACRGHDRPAMRHLLAAWQSSALADIGADEIVVSPDGSLHALPTGPAGSIGDAASMSSPAPTDPRDSTGTPGSGEYPDPGDKLGYPDSGTPAGALRRLARAMFDEGLGHLWPTPADESEVTGLLADLAGLPAPTGPAGQHPGPSPNGRPAGSPPAEVPTLCETVAERDRLRRELAEARAQVDWCERRVAQRDAELIRANRIITALKVTAPGRAATAVAGGLRTGKRVARAALRRLRTDD